MAAKSAVAAGVIGDSTIVLLLLFTGCARQLYMYVCPSSVEALEESQLVCLKP